MGKTMCKSYNVSVLLMYYFVSPAKYRRVIINKDVNRVIRETREGIQERYEKDFWKQGQIKTTYIF